MQQELDDLLCGRYPKIFAQRVLPADGTMARGFEGIGDGWFVLIDTLCAVLQYETDCSGAPQVVAQQVKYKMGGLRFATFEASESQRGAIALAVALSERTCEACGSTVLGNFPFAHDGGSNCHVEERDGQDPRPGRDGPG